MKLLENYSFSIKAISIFNNSADNVVKEEDNVVKDNNVFNSENLF